MSDACEWENTAMEKRPWRTEFFARFADELMHRQPPVRRVLELGSGPGFLARHLLSEMPDLRMVLLDYSAAMHELARRLLGDRRRTEGRPRIRRLCVGTPGFFEGRLELHNAM
jgi:predicted O-methyltransferase YrrM